MGTPAATRMVKNNDYIGFHTRWDGDLEEMKNQILKMPEDWQKSIDLFKNVLKEDDFGTSNIKEWLLDLEKTLEDYKTNPTLETATLFYSGRSFTHHLPNPVKASGDLLDYWGADSPDLVVNYDTDKIKFRKPNISKSFELRDIEIDSKYSIFRIINEDGDSYSDLKFAGISKEELIKEILLLPLFWRDLYTVSKKVEDELIATKVEYAVQRSSSKPILKLCSKLKYFYNATKNYASLINSSSATNERLTPEEKIKNKNDIHEIVTSLITFDMYVNALTMHIIMRFPGKVYPLTFGESNLNKEPMFNLYLTDHRLSGIYFDLKIDDQSITETIDEFKIREKKFCDYYNLKDIPSYQMKYFNNSNGIGIGYEETIIEVMNNQREIEIKELENKKAL